MSYLCSNGTPKLNKCPKCENNAIGQEVKVSLSVGMLLPDFIKMLTCVNCDSKWYICVSCKNMRKHMTTRQQVKIHLYSKHKKQHIVQYSIDSDVTTPDTTAVIIAEKPEVKLNFSTNQQTTYHQNNRIGLGNHYLVCKSNFNLDTEDVLRSIANDEVKMQMGIAAFVSSLSRKQRSQFSCIVSALQTSILQRSQNINKNIKNTWHYSVIPNNSTLTRNTYMEGQDALLQNLPHPIPFQLDSNHSYMRIKDMISHFMALNVRIHELWTRKYVPNDEGKSFSNIYQSPAVNNIMQRVKNLYGDENILVLLGIEFSDDFDPNNSIKANRQSVWMKCVTVSPLSTDMHNMETTFPISFGPKGVSHEIVECHMVKELKHLQSPNEHNLFYYYRTQSMVRVHFEILISLQDQPERRGCCGLMLGQGSYAARWGYSCNFNAVSHSIVSCDKCYGELLENIGVTSCNKCTNWEIVGTGCTILESDPPDHFPANASHLTDTNKISPFQLSFDILKDAVKQAHNNWIQNSWDSKNVEAYLRTFCINKDSIKKIVNNAENINTQTFLTKNCAQYPIEYAALIERMRYEPHEFEQWKAPSSWHRNVELPQHVDVIMHMVFLGVVKTVTYQIQEWTKLRGKYTAFLSYMLGTLCSLRSLNLSWLNILSYEGGKLGGWVSENYVGFLRVYKWVYSMLDTVADDVKYIEPVKPYTEWNGRECEQWLHSRGLNKTGTANEKKIRVATYMRAHNGPPLMMKPKGGSVKNVKSLVKAMQAMVSHIMSNKIDETSVNETRRHIKIFLCCFDKVDAAIRDGQSAIAQKDDMTVNVEGTYINTKPTWITSYNFMCLLNIPQQMQHFGPVSQYWEGGGMGEKYIQVAKKNFTSFRLNWHCNLLTKIVRNQTIDVISNSLEASSNHAKSHDETKKQLRYHTYKCTSLAMKQFLCNLPIAFLQLEGKEGYFFKIANNVLLELMSTTYYGEICGHHYFKWSIGNQYTIHTFLNALRSCVLLPLLCEDGIPETLSEETKLVFTAIADDYTEIDVNGKFVKRKLQYI